jgi:oligoendopeptidase F
MLKLTLLSFLLVGSLALASIVGATERSAIDEKYTWNLADLFPSTAAFEASKADVAARIPKLDRFKGHLGDSPAALLKALDAIMAVRQQFGVLSAYTHMLQDQDTRESKSLQLRQAVDQMGVELGAATSFLRPELLVLGPEKVAACVKAEPRLRPYSPFLDDILRWKPHTLSPDEERLLAQAGRLTDTGYDVHSIFTNSELPYPEVTLSTGETVRLDAAGYAKYRALPNRDDRLKVFRAFWGEYGKFRRTLGTSLYAQVQAHIFAREARHFGSSLESATFRDNIPTDVYHRLIADVRANLPTLHRYLRLRQKMLGLPELQYHDVYAPLVAGVDLRFTPEEAMALTLEAFAPLGREYVAGLERGYRQRWVDWQPSTGKRSGAYSQGTYGVHPYQLLNFNGQYDDVSTLAHESGHSMHTLLSCEHQPYVTHDYATFVAEVASTLNENLLLHYMLGRTKDDATRLSLLGNYLDSLRGTLFRQTQFAEFELAIHEKAEHGETLTSDNLTELYLNLVRAYFGHDAGICKVDDLYGAEWAYIPHFYYDFYVYQYSTSIVAAISLANGILEENRATPQQTQRRDAYLKMLASGSSKYPIDLLRDAGVDMTTSAPFATAMREMNAIMDEMEAILKRSSAGRE